MYDVILTNKAEQQLKKIDRENQQRIISALERSKIQPETHFKRLVGDKLYRLRIGNFRAIADIQKGKLIILVIRIGNRKNIYKKL